MTPPEHNIAGRMAAAFVDSRLTPLLMLAITLFGLLALQLTPREENPQIQVPGAQVRIALPGASSEEVEALLVTPLESALSEMENVEHTYATAANSLGMVQVEFDVGVSKEDALIRVLDKVAQIRPHLPAGAGLPSITPVDTDNVPVVSVALFSAVYDDFALKRLADRMAERLRSLEDVSVVQVIGGQDREIRVELDPERMMAFGVTLDQGLAALAASNLAGAMGESVQNASLSSVYLDGQVQSADDVGRLVVGNHEGRLVYLEDVADVIDGPPSERRHITRFGYGAGHPDGHKPGEFLAVSLTVAKKPGANSVFVAREVLDRVARMQKRFVPREVQVVVTRNDGQKADAAVNELVLALGVAIASVLFVLMLFLGWREALIVTLTLPLTLFLVLMFNYATGITINRVTLFGFILSLGILVDAGIVVVENIHRHLVENPHAERNSLVVLATNEIGNPTNLATFAIMAVFASLMMLTGVQGEYFSPITVDVPIAMFASLLMAYLVTPWAGARWLTPETVGGKIRFGGERLHRARLRLMANMRERVPQGVMGQIRPLGAMLDSGERITESRSGRLYDALLCALLDRRRFRWGLYLLLALLLCASLLQPAWQFIRPQGISGALSAGGVGVAFLPKDNARFFTVFIDMPEDTPLERTDQLARDLGRLLSRLPEAVDYQTNLGIPGVVDTAGLRRGSMNRYGDYLGDIRVNLLEKSRRERTSFQIVESLRQPVEALQANYPGALIRLVEDFSGPTFPATIQAEIYGPASERLRQLALAVGNQFAQTWGVVEVHDSEPADVPRNRVVIDREKAALAGVTTAQVATALAVLFQGHSAGQVHIPGERNAVLITGKVPRRHELRPDELDRIYISNAQGQRIPLSSITRTVRDLQDRPILRQDNDRVVYVGGEQASNSHIYSVLDLDARINGLPVGGGHLSTGNLGLFAEDSDTIDGYRLLWSGEARFMLDSFLEMAYSLLLAVLLVYLILVGYYRSFSLPALALVALPLAIIGVFPGHWLLGATFSGPSIIGVIALAGVGVRTSLLLMDFIRDNVELGLPLREATRTAGIVRLRPILLTALAIVLGSVTMLDDSVFGGLAISLISGTITSTVFSIFVVPTLYYHFLKKGARLREIRRDATVV